MALGASAPSSSAGSSRRRRPERRVMDVRVWYTLESSPHRMLAPLGRPTGIELLPLMRRTSNSTGEMGGATGSATQRFGKVTLKTCLSAICISSPELILDRKKDFILYVVDPEETYKATKRQRAHRASAVQSSPSVASGSRDRETSKDPNSIFVGRGFFGWVLEEEGDGDTVVVGKVSSERSDRGWDQSSDSDQEEEEEDIVEYLDVEIRMKETQAQSREQYFNMLKQFGGTTRPTSAAATPTSSGGARKQVISASSPVRQHTSHPSSQSGPSRSSAGLSAPTHNTQRSSSPIPPPQLPAQLPPGTTSAQQAQAMQLLALVQALQARQAQNQTNSLPAVSENGQGSRLSRSVSQPQINSGAAVTPAFSRTFSAIGLSSVAEPATSTDEDSTPSGSGSKAEQMYQCYNCGQEDKIKAVWRIVTLSEGTKVPFPGAFESNPCKDATPVEERQSLELDSAGSVTANGRSSWRACNRCGLFWQKWRKSRPEKLEKRKYPAKRKARETGPGESDMGDEDERDEIEYSSPVAGRETPQPPLPPPQARKRVRNRAPLDEQDLAVDNFGQLRSKRSIRENPDGKKPGRPKGCKTGAGKGKSRDAKNRERLSSVAAMPASEPGDDQPADETVTMPPIAQSSPVRSMGGRTFPWDSTAAASVSKNAANHHIIHSTPGITPARRRYGAPSHILDSSPTSALDALLDRDFNNFDFNDPKQVMSFVNSFPGLTGAGEVPRRSPRKNPTGTREDKNPYATASGSPTSKRGKSDSQAALSSFVANAATGSATPTLDLDVFSAFTNFKSPISTMKASHKVDTAARLPATSSPSSRLGDESEERSMRNESSALTSLTSPGSPSPSRNRFDNKLTKGRSHLLKSNSASSLMFSSSPTTRSQSGKTPVQIGRDEDDEDEEEDGPGGDSPTMARKGRMGSSQVCPASPSLGQKRKRDAAAAASSGSNASLPSFNVTSADGSETKLTKGVSPSPARSTSSRLARNDETDVFGGRSTPIHPPPIAPIARASLSPAQRKRLASSPRKSPMSTALVSHRKPLPATVEDAPSSSAGSSPRDDLSVLSPYDHGTVESYLDMLEDPYGLLQASNFGIPGAGGSIEIQGNGSMSLDHFAGGIQLHEKLDFGQHLRDFTDEGSKGVAAYALPGVNLNTGDRGEGSSGKAGGATSIAGTPFDATGQSSEGQTPVLEPRSPNTLLTPRKGSNSSPKASSKVDAGVAPPTTPGKVRSSPRFTNRTDTDSTTNLAMAPPLVPPKTPRLGGGEASKESSLSFPRTPSSKSGVNPTSLALASAVARSPALQRVLNAASPGGLGAGPTGWDFSALLGSHGSFSPLFATPGVGARGAAGSGAGAGPTPRGAAGRTTVNPIPFPDLTPLSPSLSRLLSGFAPSNGSGEHQQLTAAPSSSTTTSDVAFPSSSSALASLAFPENSKDLGTGGSAGAGAVAGGGGELDEEIRHEAYMDFQAMMQDPAFRELWDNASAAGTVAQGHGHGQGQIADL